MWFGTIYGLNRYDGYNFRKFENIPGDTLTLGNNNVVSLYQGTDETIWIGTSTMLSSYNPAKETFRNYNVSSLQSVIHDIKEDEEGVLWLATGSGLFSFDKKTNKTRYVATNDSVRNNIQCILISKDKNILWLSSEKGIVQLNKKTGIYKTYIFPFIAFTDISPEISHNIIEDKKGNIWMTTSANGIYQLNKATGKLQSYHVNIISPSSPQNRITTQMIEDDDGRLWIGGEGLAIFDPVKNNWSFEKTGEDDPLELPNKIRAIYKDKSSIYWIATEKGIAKYDPRLYSFNSIKPVHPYTLQTANTIIEDKYQRFWVGNYTGIGVMDANTGFYIDPAKVSGIYGEPVFSSCLSGDGSIWFGGEDKLYHIVTGPQGMIRSEKIALPVAPKQQVKAIVFDAKGIMWAGIKNAGLLRYDPAAKTFFLFKGTNDLFSTVPVSALCAARRDTLLIGTKGAGLLIMDTRTEKMNALQFDKAQPSDYLIINAIYCDTKNNTWCATEGNGLWYTNSIFSTFTHYTTKDGLQSMTIDQVMEDDAGQLWLNTGLGIEVIDPVQKRFVHYTEKDGLNSNQDSYLIKKSSGGLMRIDFNGLHIFNSASVNLNKNAPPVYINHIQVLDKIIPIFKDTSLHLSHDQNYISFDYVALNYTQSFKNRYAYYLEGLDKKWIDADDRRFATYANLDPGTYTFKVKACNNNGVWNETGTSIAIVISPPWWRTWWFYILVFISISSAAYFLFQYRLQQKLKALELRNTISRDLHDEVGSTLSSIGFLSSMVLGDAENNPKLQNTLSTISESSTRMLDAMNDIIWNIKPENDTLENINARMISFASELLEARKITLNYQLADNLKHLKLGLTVRHDFYIIFKEAVNNLAKYSCATEAIINLEIQHNWLVLSISDNGKGFDTQTVTRGNGLKNMQSRAKKMGAQFSLQSSQGKGTVIILKVKPT